MAALTSNRKRKPLAEMPANVGMARHRLSTGAGSTGVGLTPCVSLMVFSERPDGTKEHFTFSIPVSEFDRIVAKVSDYRKDDGWEK